MDRRTLEFEKTRDMRIISTSFWTEDERKLFEIWNQIKEILNHVNDIDATVKYIKFKGLKTFLKKNELTENEYLRFIYENHLIRVSSTLDIIVKLGDIILVTGIPERQLNWYGFINHAKVKNLECAKVISELESKINHLRNERHKLIHYGGHKSELIESIESNTFDNKFLKGSPYLVTHYKRERARDLKRLERDMKSNYRLCVRHTKLFMNSFVRTINLLKVGE